MRSVLSLLVIVVVSASARVADSSPLPIRNSGTESLGLPNDMTGPVVVMPEPLAAISDKELDGFARALARTGRRFIVLNPSGNHQVAFDNVCKVHRAAAVVSVRRAAESLAGDVLQCDRAPSSGEAPPAAPVTSPLVLAQLRWRPAPPTPPAVRLGAGLAVAGGAALLVSVVSGVAAGSCAIGWEPGDSRRSDSCKNIAQTAELSFKAGVVAAGAGAVIVLTSTLMRKRDEPSRGRAVHVTPFAARGLGGVGLTGQF